MQSLSPGVNTVQGYLYNIQRKAKAYHKEIKRVLKIVNLTSDITRKHKEITDQNFGHNDRAPGVWRKL